MNIQASLRRQLLSRSGPRALVISNLARYRDQVARSSAQVSIHCYAQASDRQLHPAAIPARTSACMRREHTSPVYSSTSEAPARILAYASPPLITPPHPTSGTFPFVRRYMSASTSVDAAITGAPDRPPASAAAAAPRIHGGLETVVFEMTRPSTAGDFEVTTAAMSARSAMDRSGAILISSGGCGWGGGAAGGGECGFEAEAMADRTRLMTSVSSLRPCKLRRPAFMLAALMLSQAGTTTIYMHVDDTKSDSSSAGVTPEPKRALDIPQHPSWQYPAAKSRKTLHDGMLSGL